MGEIGFSSSSVKEEPVLAFREFVYLEVSLRPDRVDSWLAAFAYHIVSACSGWLCFYGGRVYGVLVTIID